MLALLIATSMLATAVGGAHATRLRLSSNTFRIVWSEMRFVTNAGVRLTCAVTLEGEFESPAFAKTNNLRFGSVTRAIPSCPSSIRFLIGTAWNVVYESFQGTLPNITTMGFRINGFAFEWIGALYTCLYKAEASQPLVFTAFRNTMTSQITRVDTAGILPIPPFSGVFCTNARDETTVAGAGAITIRGEGEAVYLTLIT